jgi:hypothetical protein
LLYNLPFEREGAAFFGGSFSTGEGSGSGSCSLSGSVKTSFNRIYKLIVKVRPEMS